MSENWVVQHLINTLDAWNDKLAEVWKLLTVSPEHALKLFLRFAIAKGVVTYGLERYNFRQYTHGCNV